MSPALRRLAPFRVVAGLVLLSLASWASAQAPPPPGGRAGQPLAGLTPVELAAFQDGLAAFTQPLGPPAGLGPIFNDNACAPCHAAPAPGGSSGRIVTRFGLKRGRSFDPLARLGGSLIQDRVIIGCNVPPEIGPAEANVSTARRTQPLFGLGLVDAVPDATLHALAAQQAAASRSTAGRVHLVTDLETGLARVGRFGWKSQVGTLRDFSSDALLNEMGITNPSFPDESCPQGDCSALACNPRPNINDVGTLGDRMTEFQRLLAPPNRGPVGPQELAGEIVFNDLKCSSCHVSTMVSGPSDVAALSNVTFHPYSDFLLHDMGRLGDGIEQGSASGTELRTAPLWGVSLQPRFLHDGRATTLDAAISAHEGQAASARRAYGKLSQADRDALLAFLRSL